MTCEHGNDWLPPETPWPGGTNRFCKPCWRAAGGVLVKRGVTTPTRGRCLHLPLVPVRRDPTAPCRSLYACELGLGEVCPSRECQKCDSWEAD